MTPGTKKIKEDYTENTDHITVVRDTTGRPNDSQFEIHSKACYKEYAS